MAFDNEKHPFHLFDVIVNEEKLAHWKFEYRSGDTNYQIIIPNKAFNKLPSKTHNVFIIESPISPASLCLSADTRLLGIALQSLKFLLTK